MTAEKAPDRFTTEQRKEKRRGRVYLDTMRNAYGQLAVAPYAVRALPGAPVAAPLTWDELARMNSAQSYTIENIHRRLARTDDPWKDIARRARGIRAAIRQLEILEEEQTLATPSTSTKALVGRVRLSLRRRLGSRGRSFW
jgi:bifunctional non-homologous end joining protein LigD